MTASPDLHLVDGFATEFHYLAHLAPIWSALPAERRGVFWVAGLIADQAGRQGIGGSMIGYPKASSRATLVASYKDEIACPRPTIYVEHGAGQSYRGAAESADDPSYSGSSWHNRTMLFLCPNVEVADRWKERYPATPAEVVGCPRLDWLIGQPRSVTNGEIVVSFHSDVRLCLETATAWPEYDSVLPALVSAFPGRVVGHGHPRMMKKLRPRWRELGIPVVEDFAEVLQRAAVYVCDNSSTLYEAAACGIPTVVLNASFYRREVHHGLRFWDAIPGPQVDDPALLVDTVRQALEDPPQWRDMREKAAARAYTHRDGSSSQLAVEAVLRVVDAREARLAPSTMGVQ